MCKAAKMGLIARLNTQQKLHRMNLTALEAERDAISQEINGLEAAFDLLGHEKEKLQRELYPVETLGPDTGPKPPVSRKRKSNPLTPSNLLKVLGPQLAEKALKHLKEGKEPL